MKMLIEVCADGYDSKESMRDAILEQVPECLRDGNYDCNVLWAEKLDDLVW